MKMNIFKQKITRKKQQTEKYFLPLLRMLKLDQAKWLSATCFYEARNKKWSKKRSLILVMFSNFWNDP